MHDLIIVGGGAAGLWAAITAAERGLDVLILEKNVKSGVKILMSGGTRCNITQHCSAQSIIDAFGNQGRFLKPSVFALPPEQVVAKFNHWGVATKVESTGKVFPASDRALHVRDALVDQIKRTGAELRTGVAVRDVQPTQDNLWQVATEDQSFQSRFVLLCSGGLSYPGCGTTGDGYAWAERLGHTIVETLPALAPIVSPATWVHELTGITLPDAIVRIPAANKKDKNPRKSSRAGFLWTHFGCSGPGPMNVSRFVSQHQQARSQDPNLQRMHIEVDLVPNLSQSQLQEHLDPSRNGRRRVASLIGDWLPSKLVELLLRRSSVDEQRTIAELPRASRLQLLSDLKQLPIPVDSTRGYAKAEVTAGGVCTSQVNSHTLESRLVEGLFFAGEILDIDGPIGGYNFQAAFATAHAAALEISRRVQVGLSPNC